MASKIKDTPVLTGNDAKRFDRIMQQNMAKKVPMSDYNRAKETFERVTLKV